MISLANLQLLTNPKWYLENLTKIKTKERKVVPWKLNRVQEDLFDQLKEHQKALILKARQIGVSTGVIGYLYHDTIIHPGVNTTIVGYSREASTTLFEIVKLLWASTPAPLRPKLKYDTKYEMSFPRLKSKMSILPASRVAGRGMTIHNLLATELAFWQSEETFYGLLESVPENGRIIVESTPNGHDLLFYPLWTNPKSGFKNLEYGWQQGYSKEWAEKKRKEIGTHKFNQEYNLTFLHPESAVFSLNWLRYYDQYHPEKCKFPTYIGVDPAASLKKGSDYSAIVIIAFNPERQHIWVMDYNFGRLSNYQLAQRVITLIRKHKPLLVGIETTAYQIALRQELDRLAGEMRISLPIKEVKPFVNKLQRMRSLSTYFENGMVRVKRTQDVLLDQIATYPRCPHDDILDALEIAVSLTRENLRRPSISLIG